MISHKKKILHFIDSGGIYGAERVLLNLAELTASSSKYEPMVGCIVSHANEQNDLYDRARDMGISAEKIVIRNGRLFLDLPRVARQFRRWDIDLIHSHGYKPSVFGYAVKKMSGIEVMATCHLWFKGAKGPLKMRAMVALELFLYRSFRAVVGVSEPIKEVLINAGVPGERIRVIKNGVGVGDHLLSPPETLVRLREKLGLGKHDFCILNVGRLTKQKAQWDIVNSASILRDKGHQVRFLIVGEGDLKESLTQQIEKANLQDTVQLLGYWDDVTDLLQAADLFVLPSLDEGMPMGLLEAAAVGLPIVATSVGDIPKLIEDRVSGLLVPSNDPESLAAAISLQMSDRNWGGEMAVAAQKRVQKTYSTEAMYSHYEQVYQGLLGSDS